MSALSIGVVGTGYAADFHVRALQRVYGVDVEVRAVAGRDPGRRREFARRHGIRDDHASYEELVADPAVDVVLVCVPGALHADVVLAAARAGKHVICEKPLTGAFLGAGGEAGPGRAARELDAARRSLDEIREAVAAAGILFGYAENWVYAPTFTRAQALLEDSEGRILDIRSEQSHSGSHAADSRRRSTAGGGALMTLGAHPIAAAVQLKKDEALRRGTTVDVVSVTAEIARFQDIVAPGHAPMLVSDWEDVETWGSAVLWFSDGTTATVHASFAKLGGVRNAVEIHSTNSMIRLDMTGGDSLTTYTPDPKAFAVSMLREKAETHLGWHRVEVDGDWEKGYPQQAQHLAEALHRGVEPRTGLALAAEVVEIVYAAYLSAEEGRRVGLGTGEAR